MHAKFQDPIILKIRLYIFFCLYIKCSKTCVWTNNRKQVFPGNLFLEIPQIIKYNFKKVCNCVNKISDKTILQTLEIGNWYILGMVLNLVNWRYLLILAIFQFCLLSIHFIFSCKFYNFIILFCLKLKCLPILYRFTEKSTYILKESYIYSWGIQSGH